ncbi:MAG: VWA domain-containing protein [Sphingobacteriaceae bacterium]|nr:VWA domain-containing protein [Sphingobacteriaceae bacterium]
MKSWIHIFLLIGIRLNAQLAFNASHLKLGEIKEAFEISGDLILKNTADKKIYLLRADADNGVKILASKKTILPGDTCLLIISFIPEHEGKFNKKIKLISSDKATPNILEMSGDLKSKLKNNQQACYYFGSKRKNKTETKEIFIASRDTFQVRDNSNRIPDYAGTFTVNGKSIKEDSKISNHEKIVPVENEMELSGILYKPNNIVFLVDVSSSMKDSLKLPLMKEALYVLIKALRDVDKITFITYADSVHVLAESIPGSAKTVLNTYVNGLNGHGYTKGRKAIFKAREVAEKHFITEGNNQIFLATDGMFYFYDKDKLDWKNRNANKKIVLTTVAFGNDKSALKNLKEIAQASEGSYIKIKGRKNEEELLEEVKLRSKR